MSSNSTKTQQDFKDQIAQEYGYNNYAHFVDCPVYELKSRDHDRWEFHADVIDQSAELYAAYKAEEAYKNGIAEGVSIASIPLWQQACEAQKEVCAESAVLKDTQEYINSSIGYQWVKEIDRDSILNAPSAANPHSNEHQN